MDLILWRHAEAEETVPDHARVLTKRGLKDAAKVGEWLRDRLPDGCSVIASPAERTQQTAKALGLPFKTVRAIAPGASAEAVLEAAGWPHDDGTVVVVGHQPTLGEVAALLVAGQGAYWSVKKGGVWWITGRERHGVAQVVVTAVLSPEML